MKSGDFPSTVFLFTIRFFSRFYSRWDLGIMKLKLMIIYHFPRENDSWTFSGRAWMKTKNDWDDFIDGALFTTNTNVSSTTKFSSFIMFGRQTRLPFDVEKFVQQAERRMLQYIDKMATTRNVVVSQGRTQHNHSSGETKQGSNERGKQAQIRALRRKMLSCDATCFRKDKARSQNRR